MSAHTTVAQLIEEARQAIHQAVAAANSTDRQRSAAHHAQSLATTILTDPATTTAQRDRAGYYLQEARSIQTLTTH